MGTHSLGIISSYYIKLLVQFFMGLESNTFGVVQVHSLLGTNFLRTSQIVILFRFESRVQCFLGICPILIGYYKSITYSLATHEAKLMGEGGRVIYSNFKLIISNEYNTVFIYQYILTVKSNFSP